MISLTLPPGRYVISAGATFYNAADLIGQNNTRGVRCYMAGDTFAFDLHGDFWRDAKMWDKGAIYPGGATVSLACVASTGGTDRSYVFASDLRITAIKVDTVIVP